MHNELFIATLAGLGGMFGWGLADFFAKKAIDKIGDIASLAWGHIFGTGALFIILFYQVLQGQHFSIPSSFLVWIFLFCFGLLQAVIYIFLYKGFGKGQVGILSPVFASFSGLTALMSIIFFHENVSSYLLIGLAIIFLGILLISVDLSALRSRKFNFSHIPGLGEIAIATLLAALWTLLWDKFIGGEDWLVYTTFMYAFMTCVIFTIAKLQKVNLHIAQKSLWKFVIFIGVFEIAAYLSISIGYSSTSFTSIVALISGAFSLPVIFLARIFLKEKISTVQSIGSLIIVAGIIVLSML